MICDHIFTFPPPALALIYFSDPVPHDSAVLSPDMDDKQDEEKMDKHKKKKGAVSKAVKPKDNEGIGQSLFIHVDVSRLI